MTYLTRTFKSKITIQPINAVLLESEIALELMRAEFLKFNSKDKLMFKN